MRTVLPRAETVRWAAALRGAILLTGCTTTESLPTTSLAAARFATIADVVPTRSDDGDRAEANAPDPEQAVGLTEELRRLMDLYRLGVLTDAEFLREKTRLLGST